MSEILGENLEEKIVEGYSTAYQLNPNDEKIYMQLIEWLLKTQNSQKALEIAEKFIKKYPYSRIAMRLVGNVYANIGEIDKSIEMLQQCLKYYPDDGLAKDSLNLMKKYKK